ncbi:MAG: EamA family transporter [Verrucomicrobia bacterium]|nr:EamA family transporter [Verrucomicrobiota bacterium]
MPFLLLVSLIWAFSFALIKHLTKDFDGAFVSAARLGLALLVFLPFLRLRGLAPRTALSLAGIGAVQFGLMYLAYNESFRFLASHEVAVLTLTTPIFVTLLADAFDRTLRARALFAALLAVLGGAAIVVRSLPTAGTFAGVALVQLSNVAFALGQVLYRRLRARQPDLRDRDIFGLLYAGAFAVTLPVTLARTNFAALPFTPTNVGVLLYLGLAASCLAFFLWNLGATRVTAGTLAAMNNAKIPLAVAVSLLVFRESADLPRLALSIALMALAVWLAESASKPVQKI